VEEGSPRKSLPIPIAKATHHDSTSLFKEYVINFPEHGQDIVLYSDRSLVVKLDNPFLGRDPKILSLDDVSSVNHFQGTFKNKPVYYIVNMLSMIFGTLSVMMMISLTELAFAADSEVSLLGLIFVSLPFFGWFVIDYSLGYLATPERVEFGLGEEDPVVIRGLLPDFMIHQIGGLAIGCGFVWFLYALGDWAISEAPMLGDILIFLMGLCLTSLVGVRMVQHHSRDDNLGLDHSGVPKSHEIAHLCTAANAISKPYPETAPFDDDAKAETRSKFEDIHLRLTAHERVLASIITVNESDIIAATSPSSGVIAIRASTEQLMKKACENIGIIFETNKKRSLTNFIQLYGREHHIDSKVQTYLKDITEQGNRAAHDFNLDWNDFMIVFDRFCYTVQWYSDTFTAIGDESE
jgi:hypothetical protein